MNKKAEKYLSMYWFAILVIVAVGISLIVLIFYGKPLDVRKTESDILINKITDCISNQSILRDDITNDNFLDKCHLIIDDDYYIKINSLGISAGNLNLNEYCMQQKSKISCVSKKVYLQDNGKNIWLEISIAINKADKNE